MEAVANAANAAGVANLGANLAPNVMAGAGAKAANPTPNLGANAAQKSAPNAPQNTANLASKKDPINLNEVTGYNKSKANKPQKELKRLDNDAFMRLFLEQLKNQDPTSPMETDKIIAQTAQLTQVEMQEQTKQTMIEVANAMKSTQATNAELKNLQGDMKSTLESLVAAFGNGESSREATINSVGMIGKIAQTTRETVRLEEGKPLNFELYFDEPIDTKSTSATLLLLDPAGAVVREVDLSKYGGQSGYVGFSLEPTNSAGEPLKSGDYAVVANYNHRMDGSHSVAKIGRGEITSVVLEGGKPSLRLGKMLVPLDEAVEFMQK